MIEIKESCKCMLLLAGVLFLAFCSHAVYTMSKTLETTAKVVQALPAQLDARAQSLQTAVLAEVAGQVDITRKDVLHQLAAVNIGGKLDSALLLVDRRLGDALQRVDTALSTVDAIRQDIQPTLANVRAITDHANEASAVLLARNARDSGGHSGSAPDRAGRIRKH